MLLTHKADPMLAGGVSISIKLSLDSRCLNCFIIPQEKNQLPIHVLAQKATGAALVPLQLILKSCPKEARLSMDKVCFVNNYN